MGPGKCRACGGSLGVLPISAPAARVVSVRIIVKSAGMRRMGDFDLCPRCVAFSKVSLRRLMFRPRL